MEDLYNLILTARIQKGEGGGGGEPVLIDKTITSNGTYNASSDSADGYKKVVANVPNTYAAGDEGKVVSNGALKAQTSKNINANGTVDTTENNQVVVNVPSVTPTGNINITSTAQTDVSAYATAQVVDADLVASNIKKDVDILGVVGTYEGGGGDAAFAGYIDGSVTNLVIPNGTTKVRMYSCYYYQTLRSVVIPSSVKTIEAYAFYGCTALRTLSIAEGLQSIGSNAFQDISVSDITLPSSLTTIGSNAFRNSSITSLTVKATTPPSLGNGFAGASIGAIYVPAESVDTYKAATGWSNFASKIQAIPE